MEKLHGIIEWLPLALFAVVGFPLDRWLPARRPRHIVWALLLVAAFIMDLNKVTFKSDNFDMVFWALIMAAISEFFWIAVRKKSRLLLGGTAVILIPVFVYVYFAFIMAFPFPCHEDRREIVSVYECPAGKYTLKKRLTFDVFNPAQVFVLVRDLKKAPWLQREADKFPAPKGYIEAVFEPRWQCLDGRYRNGVKVDLYIDNYTLWSLKDEPKNDD